MDKSSWHSLSKTQRNCIALISSSPTGENGLVGVSKRTIDCLVRDGWIRYDNLTEKNGYVTWTIYRFRLTDKARAMLDFEHMFGVK